jgi:Domain of unknown function (DUF5916)
MLMIAARYLPFLFLILSIGTLNAQNKPGTELHIKKAKGEIKIDGVLDESDWNEASVAGNFFLNYPVDTAKSPFQTEARVTFNDQFFYVSFVCFDDESPDMINSLRRDFEYERNDNVGLNLGPFNDRLNGFFFVITPKGAQMEGTVSGSGNTESSYNIFWDNKWYSKVVRYPDKWIAELAIPFKSFRYKNVNEWNIAFDRSDKKRNLKSSWIHTPIQFTTGSFAYSGQLVWDDPVPPPRTNISLIPYLVGSVSTDNEKTPKENSAELRPGFDAKISVTPSLNLDLTANSDFSQVEVDQQVINLTRFEFQFPERRQFFLENSDLFDNAGFPDARIFFSRRIGLVKDSSGLYQRVPIAYGARLSGSINKNWRMSVLNMQTMKKLPVGLPSQNYSVATIQRNFWKQSNISITYTNKQSLGVDEGDSLKFFNETIFQKLPGSNSRRLNEFNRVLGADLEMLSPDNKWYSSSYFAHSFDNFSNSQNNTGGTFLRYSVRNIDAFIGSSFIGKNFNSETGFVPSYGIYPGQNNFFGSFAYKFYPKNSPIVTMGPVAEAFQTYLPNGILSDKNYSLGYSFKFLNTTTFTVTYNYIFQRMTQQFNPIDPSYTEFLIGEKYDWQNVAFQLQSNTRRIINFKGEGSYGEFYNGTNFFLRGELTARYQPYGNISLRVDYNDLKLKAGYGIEKLFLIGPRIDLTFTDKIFLTTYFQYNNVLDNMNLNARFQWRYKPASDFFIVYTENYLPSTFGSKNRALVLKFTYWFNL